MALTFLPSLVNIFCDFCNRCWSLGGGGVNVLQKFPPPVMTLTYIGSRDVICQLRYY